MVAVGGKLGAPTVLLLSALLRVGFEPLSWRRGCGPFVKN